MTKKTGDIERAPSRRRRLLGASPLPSPLRPRWPKSLNFLKARVIFLTASRAGLTPSPTCLTRQGGFPKGRCGQDLATKGF